MTTSIRVEVDDHEHEQMQKQKDGRTWRECLLDGLGIEDGDMERGDD